MIKTLSKYAYDQLMIRYNILLKLRCYLKLRAAVNQSRLSLKMSNSTSVLGYLGKQFETYKFANWKKNQFMIIPIIALMHAYFHINNYRFENDRTISFIPPDGEFELMSYRLNTHVSIK